jgi:hypothetical protein
MGGTDMKTLVQSRTAKSERGKPRKKDHWIRNGEPDGPQFTWATRKWIKRKGGEHLLTFGGLDTSNGSCQLCRENRWDGMVDIVNQKGLDVFTELLGESLPAEPRPIFVCQSCFNSHFAHHTYALEDVGHTVMKDAFKDHPEIGIHLPGGDYRKEEKEKFQKRFLEFPEFMKINFGDEFDWTQVDQNGLPEWESTFQKIIHNIEEGLPYLSEPFKDREEEEWIGGIKYWLTKLENWLSEIHQILDQRAERAKVAHML